jgi:septum formation protein
VLFRSAQRLALAKAGAVAQKQPEAIVLGSDQVASVREQILEKPGDAQRCRAQLQALSGENALFHTACAVVCLSAQFSRTHVDTTRVRVRELTADEIDRYIEREKPFDCAGGFKAEALGIALFEQIENRDPTALIGLPLIWVAEALRAAGYLVP